MPREDRNVAADLLARGLFSRYLECPVCGSADRIQLATPFQSNGYVAAGANRLGIPVKTFVDSMQGQKCLSCGALYFDPWLSLRFQNELYENLFPQHNRGWRILWSIIKEPSHHPNDTALYNMLKKEIPALKRYAELGCPFNGLIPYLSLREYQYGSKRFLDYPGTYILKTVMGQHPKVRGGLNFERLGAFCARLFNRAQLLSVFPLKRLIKRALIRLGRAQEIQRNGTHCYYIRHDSSLLWGRNCKSLGVDCPTALKNVFGVQVLSFEDLRTEKIRFDLVGVFNSLDHYKNPLELLDQIFEFTDYIYLEGHCAEDDWGKQHLYFLERDVISALPKLLSLGDTIADFKGRMSQHWYSILLKKSADAKQHSDWTQTSDDLLRL